MRIVRQLVSLRTSNLYLQLRKCGRSGAEDADWTHTSWTKSIFPSHFVWNPNTSMFVWPSGFLPSETFRTHASMCEPTAPHVTTKPKDPNSQSVCVQRRQPTFFPRKTRNQRSTKSEKKNQSSQEERSRYDKGSVRYCSAREACTNVPISHPS